MAHGGNFWFFQCGAFFCLSSGSPALTFPIQLTRFTSSSIIIENSKQDNKNNAQIVETTLPGHSITVENISQMQGLFAYGTSNFVRSVHTQGGYTLCVIRDLYAWCAQFANTRTISKLKYIHYSQSVFFQSTNLVCISKKSVNANVSFGHARTRGEITRITMRALLHACVGANQPLYTMHILLIFDIFTHNLHASHIVYSQLQNSYITMAMFKSIMFFVLTTWIHLFFRRSHIFWVLSRERSEISTCSKRDDNRQCVLYQNL